MCRTRAARSGASAPDSQSTMFQQTFLVRRQFEDARPHPVDDVELSFCPRVSTGWRAPKGLALNANRTSARASHSSGFAILRVILHDYALSRHSCVTSANYAQTGRNSLIVRIFTHLQIFDLARIKIVTKIRALLTRESNDDFARAYIREIMSRLSDSAKAR